MANGNSVKIHIDGDASDLEKEITGSVRTANSAAAKMEAAFQRAAKARSEFAKNAAISAKEDITVTIKGDSSQLKKELSDTQKAAENAADKMQEGMEKAADSASEVVKENKKIISQKEELNDVYDEIGDDAEKVSSKVQQMAIRTKAGLADIKAGIDMAAAAAKTLYGVAEKGIGYNATIEQLKTSFEVMTGSAEKAVEVTERLRVMGAETPFEMKDLASTAQLLMQYGFTADEALDRMKMLGDVAQGNVNAMNSIALGYAQMSSAGKVNLVDIKQMINGGFNPLQEISERTGESMASLYDRISKGTMAVDEITESMRYATSEGGRFFQSMEKQSQTLNGQLSTLRDNADQLLGSLTEGMSEGLRTELLPFSNNMISELQRAFETGGVQGLSNAATAMIPDLLDMMSGEFETGIAAIGKWLPKGASALMKHVPQALRGASSVVPQITTALFEVATVVITDLTAMLPELVPVVVEGFANMLGSALKGVEGMISGLFSGIEQAFHKGQTKIAGVWVDDSQIAKYTFDVDTDITPATTAIKQAYADIREALNTDLLTEEQRIEIEGMIGEDYDAIKAKLLSFGLSETEASTIAGQITAGSDTIKAEIEKLDVGVDSGTVMKWMAQAGGSRIRLKASLKQAGLKEADINEIIGLYDEMTGKIKDGTPNIVEEIYNTLTDGEADDEQTVGGLKRNIASYISGLNSAVEEEYGKRNAALDTATKDYNTKKAELDAWYETTKGEITGLNTEMEKLVSELAGAPTAVVMARMEEFAELERQLLGVEAKIEELTSRAMSAGESAYNVVRSGANADEATISQAISFKVTEFKLEEQSAEDAYNAAIEELNRQFNAGEIGKTQYNARVQTEASKLEDAKKAAREAYEQALGEIFAGIAESEGIAQAVEKAGLDQILGEALSSASEMLSFDLEGTLGDKLGPEVTQILADKLSMTPETLQNMQTVDVMGYLNDWANELFKSAEETIESIDNTKLQEVYAAALEDGVLEGTKFDTTSQQEQFSAMVTTAFSGGVELAKPAAVSAVEDLVANAETGGAESESIGSGLGGDFGSGYVQGIRSWVNAAYSAAYTVARSAAQGAAAGQDSASPSKVAMGLGGDFGEGYTIGLQQSMTRAAQVARQLTGGIATAVDITQTMRVANMPNLSQEIAFANEQNKTPVYLDGVKIAEIQGHNNSTQLAWQNTRAAKGVGSR